MAKDLCDAIETCWLQVFGPFKYLVIDGEQDMSQSGTDYHKRKGILVKPRAPGQHAQIVERRGALLRHAMHCTEEQLKVEGIPVAFKQLLAEAVFAGNALISYDGVTPSTPDLAGSHEFCRI